jgi:hypothetical protein
LKAPLWPLKAPFGAGRLSIGLVGFCHAAYFENKFDSIVAAKSDDAEQWVKRTLRKWKLYCLDEIASSPVTLNHWVVDSIPTRCITQYQGLRSMRRT